MKKFAWLLLLTPCLFGLTSCYKDPGPGTGNIIVLDANQFRVPLATVTLAQPGQNGNGIILVQGFSDIDGEFSYTHEPALEVILNVGVEKNGATGSGVIRIKPGEASEEEIVLY